MSEMRTADVIVVGGGLAGLTAAAMVARAGRSVRVFERADQVGGRARTQEKDGFLLNQGPHALYRGGRAIRVLRELGVPLEGGVPSGAGMAVREGQAYQFPGTTGALLRTGLLGAAAKLEVARLLVSIPLMKPETVAHQTVAEWLQRKVRDPEARELMAALVWVSSYANAPEQMSAGAALAQLQIGIRENVLYLDGGWQTLVDGVRRAAVEAGAEIVTGARVTAVEIAEVARGVRLADGTLHPAGAVILAVAPAEAVSLIGRERARALAAWADGAIPVRAATLDLALRSLPRPETPFALGIDRPLYLSVHSAVARLAPEGGALVHAAKYLPADIPSDPASDERELEGLLDLVQPGWREVVVHRRFLPHLVVSSALPRAAEGGEAGRPGPQVEGISNLYLAGDWVGPEGMLADAALASAVRAAELALQASRAAAAGESDHRRASDNGDPRTHLAPDRGAGEGSQPGVLAGRVA